MPEKLDNRSLGDLFSELSRETGQLVRQEVELAKTEMTAQARQAGGYAGVAAAAGPPPPAAEAARAGRLPEGGEVGGDEPRLERMPPRSCVVGLFFCHRSSCRAGPDQRAATMDFAGGVVGATRSMTSA